MALSKDDFNSNSWWIWDKARDKENALNDYSQSVQNLADEYNKEAANENYSTDIRNAQQDSNKTTKAQDDVSIADQNTKNTISGNRQTNSTNVSSYSKANQSNRQNSLEALQAKRDYKNQKAQGYLKLASDEAKIKYEYYSARYSQAMTNISNTIKTLTSLGLSIWGGKIKNAIGLTNNNKE
jgi:hypothetical protein